MLIEKTFTFGDLAENYFPPGVGICFPAIRWPITGGPAQMGCIAANCIRARYAIMTCCPAVQTGEFQLFITAKNNSFPAADAIAAINVGTGASSILLTTGSTVNASSNLYMMTDVLFVYRPATGNADCGITRSSRCMLTPDTQIKLKVCFERRQETQNVPATTTVNVWYPVEF